MEKVNGYVYAVYSTGYRLYLKLALPEDDGLKDI